MEAWGGWFLFGLFAAILVWEEVWDLPQTAYLSSWLLLLITAGAVVCSAFFERRLWCRCVSLRAGLVPGCGLYSYSRQGICRTCAGSMHKCMHAMKQWLVPLAAELRRLLCCCVLPGTCVPLGA